MHEIENRLDDEIERAQQLRNYDQQEFNEIVEIVQNLDTEESKMDKLGNMFGGQPQFEKEVDTIIELIEEVESMAQQLSSEHQA